MTDAVLDIDTIRATEFPWTARGDAIYLNHASTGPLPRRTLDAVAALDALRAEPWRLGADLQLSIVARARSLCARLVGADASEIALMTNTTHGINVAARALRLRAGDVVLTYDREFPANIYPWMALGGDGVRLERIPCIGRGLPDEEALMAALERPEVRVVAISWVQFATGYRTDLARVGRRCRERGIHFVVDAMQGVGAATLDVRACGIDLLACGGQKWLLGPWGSGFLYVSRELVTRLEPSAVGWMAVRDSEDFTRLVEYDFTYRDDARRFEVATLPYQDFAGLSASVEMLLDVGLDRVERRIAGLADAIVAWASARDDIALVTPADRARRAGIVAVAPRDPVAATRRLAEAGVAHSLREGAIRLSPHFYNTPRELERALSILGGDS